MSGTPDIPTAESSWTVLPFLARGNERIFAVSRSPLFWLRAETSLSPHMASKPLPRRLSLISRRNSSERASIRQVISSTKRGGSRPLGHRSRAAGRGAGRGNRAVQRPRRRAMPCANGCRLIPPRHPRQPALQRSCAGLAALHQRVRSRSNSASPSASRLFPQGSYERRFLGISRAERSGNNPARRIAPAAGKCAVARHAISVWALCRHRRHLSMFACRISQLRHIS